MTSISTNLIPLLLGAFSLTTAAVWAEESKLPIVMERQIDAEVGACELKMELQPEVAVCHCHKALELLAPYNTSHKVRVYAMLSYANIARGNRKDAERLAEKASSAAIIAGGKNSWFYAYALAHKAVIYNYQSRWSTGDVLINKAIALFERVQTKSDRQKEPDVVAFRNKEYFEALDAKLLCSVALNREAESRRIAALPTLIAAYERVGQIEFENGNKRNAMRLFEKSIDIYDKLVTPYEKAHLPLFFSGVPKVMKQLSVIYESSGETEKAKKLAAEAKEYQELDESLERLERYR